MNFRSGVTLVELAIVLTIIGLLTGGALVGRDLVRSSELYSLNADAKRYTAAVNAFHDKYHALPGDMANATSYWGLLGGTGADATCQNTKATGLPTCNGNGDGHILTSAVATDEMYRFWQHLANAGLVGGQYAGTTNGFTPAIQPGINVPSTKLSGVGWVVSWYGYLAGTTSLFAGNYGHILVPANTSASTSSIFSPRDAYQIDSKFDDGLPSSGTIWGYKGTATLKCTNKYNTAAGSDLNATYNMSDTAPECVLYFVNIF